MKSHETNGDAEDNDPLDILHELEEQLNEPFQDPVEAAHALVENFFHVRGVKEELHAQPYSEKARLDEAQADAEDMAGDFLTEKADDALRDFWKDRIPLRLRGATVAQLLKMKREDAVKELDRLSDLSDFMDAETLKRIREG